MAELGIALDKVCWLILEARAFDAQDPVSDDPDEGSNAIDEDFREVLEPHGDDPTRAELRDFIDALNDDEQVELVALVWVGRGDFDADEWADALRQARARRTGPTSAYLLGIPVLGDYLEEGLAAFGLSCSDGDSERV